MHIDGFDEDDLDSNDDEKEGEEGANCPTIYLTKRKEGVMQTLEIDVDNQGFGKRYWFYLSSQQD